MRERLVDLSPTELFVRQAKVALHRSRRLADWALRPARWSRPPVGAADDFPHLIYQRAVPLAREDEGADPELDVGKRHNLAIAAPHFHGLVLDDAAPLSFWRVLGRPTRARGFRVGMELRGGCIVPTVGGGLCLLSNELFRAASLLDWRILERHGHTMTVAEIEDTTDPWGLDATVFWPYVDLRVAPRRGRAHLAVRCTTTELVVEIRGDVASRARSELREEGRQTTGRIRQNRIVRTSYDESAVVRREVIASNRKVLLRPAEERKNCLTCQESCHARPRGLR